MRAPDSMYSIASLFGLVCWPLGLGVPYICVAILYRFSFFRGLTPLALCRRE
ncbi:hypothetical protein MtrunA17_Chr1g0176981 [Medicago truncatula]|uniref:Transmembrane protein n=1 Tax=Medicago truncatula TaxID=3880 RepID=A0A396JSW1_MEDTR|nr:hypothetical protein MtrunA17_Chr1g0176981 [Medicago truncatula]